MPRWHLLPRRPVQAHPAEVLHSRYPELSVSHDRLWSGGLDGLRSVSFDLDGTYADTSRDLAGALNALRVELGQDPLPVPDVARFVGRGARWLVTNCVDRLTCDAVESQVLRFLDLYTDCCTDTTAPYAGLDALVADLRDRGLRVSIATNKPRRYTEAIIDGLGWEGHFDSVHCGDDGPSKPDPAMLEASIRAAESTPETHLHVGDTPTDAEAAARIGCLFAPVFWGMDGGEALRDRCSQGFSETSDLIRAFEG